jgi:hypothetical protein
MCVCVCVGRIPEEIFWSERTAQQEAAILLQYSNTQFTGALHYSITHSLTHSLTYLHTYTHTLTHLHSHTYTLTHTHTHIVSELYYTVHTT